MTSKAPLLVILLLLACDDRPKTIGELPPRDPNDPGDPMDPSDPGSGSPCALGLTGEPAPADGGIVKLAAGDQHTCALFGSGGVWCWGDNRLGSIGDGTRDNKRATPVGARGIDDAIDVAIGVERSCALRADGTVACWGMIGPYGFDLLNPVSSDFPKCTSGLSDGVAITGGHYHYCAVRESGELACWGENGNGELADLSDDWRRTPFPIPGVAGVERVATGSDHSCALAGGRIWCWGSNRAGQLGAGIDETGATPLPEEVVGIEDAIDVVAGADHTCALRRGGTVSCWGASWSGQIVSDAGGTNVPLDVAGLPEIAELAAGDLHTCARSTGGRLFCWGAAHDGRIGPNASEDTATPIEVPNLGVVTHVAAGGQHTCVLSGAEVLCFGANDAGQLGDGTLLSRAEPAPVLF